MSGDLQAQIQAQIEKMKDAEYQAARKQKRDEEFAKKQKQAEEEQQQASLFSHLVGALNKRRAKMNEEVPDAQKQLARKHANPSVTNTSSETSKTSVKSESVTAAKDQPTKSAPKQAEIKKHSQITARESELVGKQESTGTSEKGNVAEKVDFFNKTKVHPYSTPGGNLASSGGNNRATVETPSVTPAPRKQSVVTETKAPVVQTSPAPKKQVSSKIADKVDLFEKTQVHPYSTPGGNLASSGGNNRATVETPSVTPTPRKQSVVTETKAPVVQTRSEPKPQRVTVKSQEESDHELAARLQVEELIKEPVAFPEDMDKSTLDELAADIYRQGLADLPRPQQSSAKAHHGQQEEMEYLSGFAMSLYMQTYSLQVAIVGNQLIIREVQQAMLINVFATQDSMQLSIQAAFSESYASVGYQRNGLFGSRNPMSSSHQATEKARKTSESEDEQTHRLSDSTAIVRRQ
jgi:hypothetical protein